MLLLLTRFVLWILAMLACALAINHCFDSMSRITAALCSLGCVILTLLVTLYIWESPPRCEAPAVH